MLKINIGCCKLIFDTNKSFELITAMRNAATARTLPIVRRNYEVCTVEYVLSGSGFLELDGNKALQVCADEVYFLPKHSNHIYYPDRENPWDKLFFVVNGDFMEKIFALYNLAHPPVIRNAASLKHYFTEFIKLHSGNADLHMAALLFHEFAADCLQLTLQSATPELNIEEKLRLALCGDLDKDFTIREYAAKHNLTSEHLIRLFRKKFGTTPQAYRLARKMEEARRLLVYSELSVKEIAAMTGFADQYSFSHSFKKHCGKSPRYFRQQREG